MPAQTNSLPVNSNEIGVHSVCENCVFGQVNVWDTITHTHWFGKDPVIVNGVFAPV